MNGSLVGAVQEGQGLVFSASENTKMLLLLFQDHER